MGGCGTAGKGSGKASAVPPASPSCPRATAAPPGISDRCGVWILFLEPSEVQGSPSPVRTDGSCLASPLHCWLVFSSRRLSGIPLAFMAFGKCISCFTLAFLIFCFCAVLFYVCDAASTLFLCLKSIKGSDLAESHFSIASSSSLLFPLQMVST